MAGQSKIILLADDDTDDQEMLKDIFAGLEPDSKVHSVLNGKQVLEFLETCEDRNLPDLIILDYNMPELNGPQVLLSLRSLPRYDAIPKLVWSTSNTNSFIRECKEKGATEYFVKPNSMSELSAIAKKMLALCN